MSPALYNLQPRCSKHKSNFCTPKCPYCHSRHNWRHGVYTRKGFHGRKGQCQAIIEAVQRFLCRQPSCGHSFSVLPPEVLPYCRFFLHDALAIEQALLNGSSAYSIATYQWNIPLAVILRFKRLFVKVSSWLKQLFRETFSYAAHTTGSLIGALLRHYSWDEFGNMWFRRIYPARFK